MCYKRTLDAFPLKKYGRGNVLGKGLASTLHLKKIPLVASRLAWGDSEIEKAT